MPQRTSAYLPQCSNHRVIKKEKKKKKTQFVDQKKKKSETELTAIVLKKKIQNTQEIKRTLFNQTKQDKRCKISSKSSFSSYVQQYSNMPSNNSHITLYTHRNPYSTPGTNTSMTENTQEIKRTLFNQTKQNKTCKFSRKASFSSYVQQYNRKQLNQLVSV